MAPRSSKKQTAEPSTTTRTRTRSQAAAADQPSKKTKTKVQTKKAGESTAATTTKARGKKGKKPSTKDAKDVEENDDTVTISDPTPVVAGPSTPLPVDASGGPPINTNQPTAEAAPSTSQDDFSDLNPNNLRLIREAAEEMTSNFVAAHPGGISKEDEYPADDKEQYNLHRAGLELLQKRVPAVPLPCSVISTRGRVNLDGVPERQVTDLQYAPWTKEFDGPNITAKQSPHWWAPIDRFMFEVGWNEAVPTFKEKNGGRGERPWEFQTDEWREEHLGRFSSAQLWGLDYDSETWPTAKSRYTDAEGVVHNVGAEWVEFRKADEIKKQAEGGPRKSCLVVKDADELSTAVNTDEDGSIVRESSTDDDTLVADASPSPAEVDDDTSKTSAGVRFSTPRGSKRRRDEEEEQEEEKEARSPRRQRIDGGATVTPTPVASSVTSPRRSMRQRG